MRRWRTTRWSGWRSASSIPATPWTPSCRNPWPGPEPGTFLSPTGRGYGVIACGVLTAGPDRTAYATALTNPGQVWSVDPEQRYLAVVPILPGYEPCPT